MTCSVLVVEDHPLFRFGLTSVLGIHPEYTVCGEAEDIKTALTLFQREAPDLVIMDLTLRDGNAINLIRAFRARSESVRILVISMLDEQLYAERCIKLGANGFLGKDMAPTQLMQAVSEVRAGNTWRSPAMTTLPGSPVTREREGSCPETVLSNREIEVFFMMGKGLSTKRIADHLHLSPKTVDTHREHIKRKLGVFENTELIQRAVKWVMREAMI
jgi:DNA-binding NarL/FixJ family response regulator